MLLSGFTAEFKLVFVLTLENAVSETFHFKANIKSIGSSKKRYQNSPPFDRSECFYVRISGNFERFQYFNFETDFLDNENLSQKTGLPLFS